MLDSFIGNEYFTKMQRTGKRIYDLPIPLNSHVSQVNWFIDNG